MGFVGVHQAVVLTELADLCRRPRTVPVQRRRAQRELQVGDLARHEVAVADVPGVEGDGRMVCMLDLPSAPQMRAWAGYAWVGG
jgi:hypothetical protein